MSALPPKHRILVVDDDAFNRQIMNEILAEEHTVLTAEHGLKALQLAKETSISLILLDVIMPDLDGYEVLRRLKAQPQTRDIPVIFISGLTGTHDEETGLMLGALDYIAKPFSHALIRARINNHLRIVEQHQLLEKLTQLDSLTGAAKRSRFDEVLLSEWRRACRNHDPISLALVDIDCFAQYCDFYGPDSTDSLLRALAKLISSGLKRPSDFIARYSEQTFALLMPLTSDEGAARLGRQLGKAIAGLKLPHERSLVCPYVTVSIGGATCNPAPDLPESSLCKLAEGMLRHAQTHGRNRLQWHSTPIVEVSAK